MDFTKYSLKTTIKACCMYEQMTGKSFFKITDEEEIVRFMYSCFVINNEIRITFDAFLEMLQDKKVLQWFTTEYQRTSKFIAQFDSIAEESNESGDSKPVENKMTMTDFATALIFTYHLDPHYVFYEAEVWEIGYLLQAANATYENDMEEKRLWSFVQIAPNINHKKCKGPEDFMPFPWEKDKKKKKNEEGLRMNEYAVKHTIGQKLNI